MGIVIMGKNKLYAPQNLRAYSQNSHIALRWDSTVPDMQIVIERSVNEGVSFIEIDRIDSSNTSYIDTTHSALDTSYYRIRIAIGAFLSAYSNMVSKNPCFMFTIDTSLQYSENVTYRPFFNGEGYNAVIYWGDGTNTVLSGDLSQAVVHNYPEVGIYQIKITGYLPFIQLGLDDYIAPVSIDNWGASAWINTAGMFHECINIVANYSDYPDMSNVVNCNSMFSFCTLFNGNVSNFDTSAVTSMFGMFDNCTAFKQSLATFDISALISIYSLQNMLVGCDINETGTSTNYDDTLIAWAIASTPSNMIFDGGNSKYGSGAGLTARNYLTNTKNWTITDGGQL